MSAINFSPLEHNVERATWRAAAAMLCLVGFSLIGVFFSAGTLMRLGFPIGSLLVGIYLYCRYPVLYVGFTWWMWFLTPLLTRLIDYRSGWDERRLMIVAPFLVSLVSVATFARGLRLLRQQSFFPFALALTALSYSLGIGLIKNPAQAVLLGALNWVPPIFFGFHLATNWRLFARYRQIMINSFLWGTLVMGLYGVVQYLVAPEWDRFWLTSSETCCMGTPEPLGIRVWSTMNSPGPFSMYMMVGLILLFNNKSIWRIPAAAFGYLSLLLTQARTAWGAWTISFLFFLIPMSAKFKVRILFGLAIAVVCVYPLTVIEPFADVIAARFQTFNNIQEDGSYNERVNIYDHGLSSALSEFSGKGLGREVEVQPTAIIDSGFLDLLFTLGWVGAAPYVGAIILLFLNFFRYVESRTDPFVNASRAVSAGALSTLIIGSTMIAAPGFLLWSFLSISVAAQSYYRHLNAFQPEEGMLA